MPQYALARHVFVCMQGEHVVFLDVRQDRYFALEAAITSGLGQLVSGWPVASLDSAGTSDSVLSLLMEKGILIDTHNDGKDAAPVDVPVCRIELVADTFDESPRVGLRAMFRFVRAAFIARLLLKNRSLEYVVERARVRRERRSTSPRAFDARRAHDLVARYAALRPFFFSAKDACLLDALALSEFLAAYRLFPRWVFGVQARPFAAHCWLQDDDVVLNDTIEHVKRYTPIMMT
jgi:hypothetical protein